MDPELDYDPYARWTREQFEEALAALVALLAHPGYRLLMDDVNAQVEGLNGRLLRANDMNEVCRTQGALRALTDLAEWRPGESRCRQMIQYFAGRIKEFDGNPDPNA